MVCLSQNNHYIIIRKILLIKVASSIGWLSQQREDFLLKGDMAKVASPIDHVNVMSAGLL